MAGRLSVECPGFSDQRVASSAAADGTTGPRLQEVRAKGLGFRGLGFKGYSGRI